MTRRTLTTLGSALLSFSLLLTACGSTDDQPTAGTSSEAPSDTEHNDADVAFGNGMIPHHAQALAMVDLTRGRPMSEDFAALTEQIRTAQAPEIETMSGWLTSWGEDIPATSRDHVNGSDADTGDMGDLEGMDGMDGMDEMPGMMSDADMGRLEASSNVEFEKLFLEMMIQHHEGAIEMAQQELDEGRFQPALDLAQAIIDGQTAEIEQMQGMMGS